MRDCTIFSKVKTGMGLFLKLHPSPLVKFICNGSKSRPSQTFLAFLLQFYLLKPRCQVLPSRQHPWKTHLQSHGQKASMKRPDSGFISSGGKKKASHQSLLGDYNLSYADNPVEGKCGHHPRPPPSTNIQNTILNCSLNKVTAHSAHSHWFYFKGKF